MAITQPKNRKGDQGDPGLDGSDGSFWFPVEGKPDKLLGNDGDWALDISSGDAYFKDSGVWLLQINLKGKPGKPGKPGEDGKPGTDGKTIIRTGHLMAGGSGGASGNNQVVEKVAITLTANVWQSVPFVELVKIADVEVYDDAGEERVEIDIKFNALETQVQLRSKKTKTFTVRAEGYKG